MKEKIMILGAGRGQVDLIQTAKRMGYETVVASIKGDYPGFKIADEICYADISDTKEIADAAARYKVGGIATACLDTGIAALGYACEKNGLTGLSEAAARYSGNKYLMKKSFQKKNVNSAKYKKVNSLEEAMCVIKELQFPLIVKAVDLQGSRGINIVSNPEELISGYKSSMQETRENYCIIEEYIEGYKFGATAFIYNKKVLFVLPTGDITYLGNTKIPIGHYIPLGLDEEIFDKVEKEVSLAISAVQLDNCAVDVDLILKDGEVYVIEITGRLGANCLPQLTSIYLGVNIYNLVVETAMGHDPSHYIEKQNENNGCGYAKMLISTKNGILTNIINNNAESSDIVDISFFVKPGDRIKKFTNAKDCIGQIVVKGRNVETCKKRIQEVEDKIIFEME